MTKPAATNQDVIDGQTQLSASIAAVDTKLSGLATEFKAFKAYAETGFEAIDRRFDRLEDRFDKLEDRFDTLESSLPYQH
jgi:septation ring formation regulator EzrA